MGYKYSLSEIIRYILEIGGKSFWKGNTCINLVEINDNITLYQPKSMPISC